MEISARGKGSVWEQSKEVPTKSDLARDVENALLTILRRTEQFEPLDPQKDEWDDPMALDLPETQRIRQFIKEMKLSLKQLALVGDALERTAARYRNAYFEHEQAQWDDREEYIEARPFSECLRCWTEGYSTNRQRSWQNYLVEAAKPLQKNWKLGKEPQEKEFYMLRYEFVKLYERNANDGRLFHDKHGNVIPKPKGGLRPNGPVHEEKEVELWVCDSRDPFGHGDVYSKKPGEEFIRGGNHLVKDGKKIEQYALKATEFDRYFCPDSKRCGGVLVPRFRDEFATEMVD
jgi:hypothetical protein